MAPPVTGEWFVLAPRWAWVSPSLGFAFIAVVGVNGFIADPDFFWAIWIGLGALILIAWLRSPNQVRLDTDGMLHVRAVLRRFTVPAAHVRIVRRPWWNSFGYVLEADEAKVFFAIPLRETFDFVSALKTHNPSLIVKGV